MPVFFFLRWLHKYMYPKVDKLLGACAEQWAIITGFSYQNNLTLRVYFAESWLHLPLGEKVSLKDSLRLVMKAVAWMSLWLYWVKWWTNTKRMVELQNQVLNSCETFELAIITLAAVSDKMLLPGAPLLNFCATCKDVQLFLSALGHNPCSSFN